MSVIDRFLNAMKMNDDDLPDDDYLDDEDEDDFDDIPESRSRRRIINRDGQETDEAEDASAGFSADLAAPIETKQSRQRQTRSSSKVSPMRTGSRKPGMEVCVIRPSSIEDAREVTETLLDECTVILNMEGIDFDLAQRIIDFACGSCFAIHGKLQKVSSYIFIITPSSVDITGDFQELMSGAYDVPSINPGF